MRKSKGVLTVEAALIVPLFVFAILFISQFMKIVYVYDTVQTNVYNTAKFINGYTYVAEGITDEVQGIVNDLQGIFTDATGISDMPGEVGNFMQEVAQSGVNAISTAAVSNVAKFFLEDELKSITGDNYQQKLGLDGNFDFSKSNVVPGETRLVVTYKIKVSVPFFKLDKDGISMTNQVVIKNLAS